MRAHLYEFRSDVRTLKCSCGWERKLKSADGTAAAKIFAAHRRDAAS